MLLRDHIVRIISEENYTQVIPNDDMRADSRADPLFLIRITQEGREMCRFAERAANVRRSSLILLG